MPAELHVNQAGTWRRAAGVYYNDAGTWRTLREVWRHDGAAWRLVFSGFQATNQNFTVINYTGVAPQARFRADGSVTRQNDSNSQVSAGDWGAPITAGVGAGYWIRVTDGGGTGTLNGDPINTWLNLGTERVFSIAVAPLGSARSRSLTYAIASDAAGSNVVGSGYITLDSDRS